MADPVLDHLSHAGAWELAPSRAKFATTTGGDWALNQTAEQRQAGAQTSTSWYADDGVRYSAMYALPDGTLYGRRGAAPYAPPPTAADNFGAYPGLNPGDPEQTDQADSNSGGALGAIWADNTGQDDRSRYTNSGGAMTNFPRRVNGNMSPNGGTQTGACSGASIGPRMVLTAAHCVYDSTNDVWTLSGYFNPGQTDTATPNGSFAWHGVFASDQTFDMGEYDYGLFYVDDSEAFFDLGYLGIEWFTGGAGYAGITASNRGYPCGADQACGATTTQQCAASPLTSHQCDGWMYGMDTTLSSDAFRADGLMNFHNDISIGHSGSAVYDSATQAVLAVVTTQLVNVDVCTEHYNYEDHYECPSSYPSQGPRFRQDMWNDVCSWIANPDGQSMYGEHPLCHP